MIIIGYQAHGTPGRKLIDGASEIRLFGEMLPVRAQIHTIGGLSAHAGQRGLIDWYDHFDDRPALVLVHGEPHAQARLKQVIQDELVAPVHVASPSDKFDLAKPVPF